MHRRNDNGYVQEIATNSRLGRAGQRIYRRYAYNGSGCESLRTGRQGRGYDEGKGRQSLCGETRKPLRSEGRQSVRA